MAVVDWMQPSDPRIAARVVRRLALIAVTVTVVFLAAQQDEVTGRRSEVVVLGTVVLLCLVLVVGVGFVLHGNRAAWAICPFVAVGAIVVLDLATFDASLAAQIFFLFPILFAATLLPWQGAAMVTATCVAGEVVVVFSNLPWREALVDTGYMGAALVTTAALLAHGAERQRRLMAELEHHASRDSLTGLATRRVLDAATEAALADARPDVGTALVLLDVDLFKAINDRFGHPGGDAVLMQLSEILVRSSRHGDVVCRLGGDELAVLMPGCAVDVARRRAREMLEAVRGHGFALDVGDVVNVSVSAGLAHAPADAETPDALYAAADAALYEAKRSGRDRLVATS